ncbi:unnamed protein product [Gulo gulo]|uniref:Uncharacterized protein n=1 Tax=Gulo gulo TaxID=48420 RepID=A0A9X9Q3W2_GULGU|nr:unnamed protein product [Gulo gulo]
MPCTSSGTVETSPCPWGFSHEFLDWHFSFPALRSHGWASPWHWDESWWVGGLAPSTVPGSECMFLRLERRGIGAKKSLSPGGQPGSHDRN